MEAIAKAMNLRCSARKMRQVCDLYRNKPVESVLASLFVLKQQKKSAEMVDKVLKAAVANLKDQNLNTSVEVSEFSITKMTVDQGAPIKRIRPRAQGRAFKILKKQCHLTVVISN